MKYIGWLVNAVTGEKITDLGEDISRTAFRNKAKEYIKSHPGNYNSLYIITKDIDNDDIPTIFSSKIQFIDKPGIITNNIYYLQHEF